jgi:hypothetical protein
MSQIELSVGQDHVEAISKIRNPIIAIEELIWNGLDADATIVNVNLSFTELGALQRVTVADNGRGMKYCDRETAFGSLGDSPKLHKRVTDQGRVVHGRSGKGRFRAFGVGRSVTWKIRYRNNGVCKGFTIHSTRATLKTFDISEETAVDGEPGVEVVISDIEQNHPSLAKAADAAAELSRRLALYLKQYPGIKIAYDGHLVDPSALEAARAVYPTTLKNRAGEEVDAELTVVEWKAPMQRALYLCDPSGFALEERSPGIQAPGFQFTAYLKSELIPELADENVFALDELHPVVDDMLARVKGLLRTHFREREASRAADLVRQWKEEKVYPFEFPPADPLDKAERDVFDVCAIKVHEYLPDFEKAEATSKKLTFRLLREALTRSPESVGRILDQVLELPPAQQEELARILQRTKLGAVLNAAKTVVDRLDFLGSLDCLLFGDFKEALLERQQFHRILAEELWVFGEQYTLGLDDQSLRALLEKHIKILGREELSPFLGAEVKDLEGKNRILDLMLYRRYPQSAPSHFEHLVVELKRPTCVLGQTEIGQIENYAFTVAADERFDKGRTRWTFVLIGNELNDFAHQRCGVQGREFGHIHASADGSVNIWIKKWSTVIAEAKWRYGFLREQLALEVSTTDGLQYLRSKYAKYLPRDDAIPIANWASAGPTGPPALPPPRST